MHNTYRTAVHNTYRTAVHFTLGTPMTTVRWVVQPTGLPLAPLRYVPPIQDFEGLESWNRRKSWFSPNPEPFYWEKPTVPSKPARPNQLSRRLGKPEDHRLPILRGVAFQEAVRKLKDFQNLAPIFSHLRYAYYYDALGLSLALHLYAEGGAPRLRTRLLEKIQFLEELIQEDNSSKDLLALGAYIDILWILKIVRIHYKMYDDTDLDLPVPKYVKQLVATCMKSERP